MLDRFLKIYFLDHSQIVLIKGWFEFGVVENKGLAFGIPLALTITYIIIGVVILGLVYFLLKMARQKRFFETGIIVFLLLGAFSNLLDRLRYQAVIDYLHFWRWSVFNLADAMIVVAVLVYLGYMSRHRESLKVDKNS